MQRSARDQALVSGDGTSLVWTGRHNAAAVESAGQASEQGWAFRHFNMSGHLDAAYTASLVRRIAMGVEECEVFMAANHAGAPMICRYDRLRSAQQGFPSD